ncbi:MAG: D-alanine--D-alanine ligase [Calditrichia bacterium]
MKSKKIAVFLGGISSERDVSIVTGVNIARGLDQLGYQVLALDVAHGPSEIDFKSDNYSVHPVPPDSIALKKLESNIIRAVQFVLDEKIDLVFNALHGGYGENGQLPALLELAGVPFTGSDSKSSAIAMDKEFTKIIAEKWGIPTAPWIMIDSVSPKMIDIPFPYPVVVKPATEGSTVGLTIVQSPDHLAEALELASKYCSKILIEQFIPGRELTVSILGEDALPLIEIRPKSGFYDYESKYQSGKTEYLVPAPIQPDLAESMQKDALMLYQKIGLRHYARIDFRLHEDGEHYYLLEANNLPGMTPTSLVPKAAGAVGLGFNDILDKIVKMALEG